MELAKKSKCGKINRTTITNYIGKILHSRQEFPPLLGRYIDYATCEPLHLKNNLCKEMFTKLLFAVLGQNNIGTNISYKDLSVSSILVLFVNFIANEMNCKQLSKRL